MKTILAPIDFSESSDDVVKAAAELAEVYAGRVVLLHIAQPPVMTSDFGVGLENVQEIMAITETTAAKNLHHQHAKLTRKGVPVETILVTGAPIPLILEQATTCKANFIVMGSHGHTALYDLLVGSTTHGVIKGASCPVVVLPRKPKPAKS